MIRYFLRQLFFFFFIFFFNHLGTVRSSEWLQLFFNPCIIHRMLLANISWVTHKHFISDSVWQGWVKQHTKTSRSVSKFSNEFITHADWGTLGKQFWLRLCLPTSSNIWHFWRKQDYSSSMLPLTFHDKTLMYLTRTSNFTVQFSVLIAQYLLFTSKRSKDFGSFLTSDLFVKC